MDATLWIEIAKVALSAAGAGAQVFASKAKSLEERLSVKPRKAGEDIRDALRNLAEDQ
jgi:hypothetical protein